MEPRMLNCTNGEVSFAIDTMSFHCIDMRVPQALRHEHGKRLAVQFLACETEDPLRCRVGKHDPAFLIDNYNRIQSSLGDDAISLLALSQRNLHLHALCNLPFEIPIRLAKSCGHCIKRRRKLGKLIIAFDADPVIKVPSANDRGTVSELSDASGKSPAHGP